MILASPSAPPLAPSPDEGRSWLRHELAHREYHDLDIVQRLLRWLGRLLDGSLSTDGGLSWPSTIATMVVIITLVLGVGLLVSRARREPGQGRSRKGGVITEEVVTAAELRSRAEAAYAAGDHATAVVDGFRALARRQVERGRLEDDPGLTADEVARTLERELPVEGRALATARLFDEVLYGDHPATVEQAAGVLSLEHELAVAR